MSNTFSLDIRKFVEKAKANADEVVQNVALKLFERITLRSPVGNPKLWAANAIAAQYNAEVANANAALRADPANLTKAKHLRPGRKIKDSMEIGAPAGYVGGRFRRNWLVSVGAPAAGVVDGVDPSGQEAIADAKAVLATIHAGPSIFITNNLPYAYRLEFEAWSKQAPAGMVRVTVAEFQQIVSEAVSKLDT